MPALEPKHGTRYQELAGRLRQARKRAGLTQAEAARELSRPQSFIAKCESGERRVDFLELKAFATVYQAPLEFFDGDAEPGAVTESPS